MRLIIGLGNPGQTFHGTRHNIGFMVVDVLARRHKISVNQPMPDAVSGRPAGVFGAYEEGDLAVHLFMPLTMMNESGKAISVLSAPPEDLLIVCDDVNLPLGTMRIRAHGGDGGHKGLASCLSVLGDVPVARIRIGIGTDRMPRELEDFVLSRFDSEEVPIVERSIERAAQACEIWAREGLDAAMNRYNTKV